MDEITVRQLIQTIVLECYDVGDMARDKIFISINTSNETDTGIEFELTEEQLKKLHDGESSMSIINVSDDILSREVENWHPMFHPVINSEKPEGYFHVVILTKS